MPDTKTLDQVVRIITTAPSVHDQAVISTELRPFERAQAERELRAAPDLMELVPESACGSAFCVAGWALILKGYEYQPEQEWFFRPGTDKADFNHANRVDALPTAADELGISYLEATGGGEMMLQGIFQGGTTLEQILDWVAYYKGEITQEELQDRLSPGIDA